MTTQNIMGMVKKNKLVKPYLKWAGGKRQLLSELKFYSPSGYKTYYEPFVGAGAFFLDLQRDKVVINDMNSDLILTFRVIKDNADALIDELKKYETKNNSEDFYKIRRMDRDSSTYNKMSDVSKAARMIYLNKTCYNGLYRVNSQGFFNTPFGKYKNPAICDENTIKAVSSYLNDASSLKIMNGDFEDCLVDAEKNDFVYFDPPYHSVFTGYQSEGFDEKEQKRLFDIFKELSNNNVKCMLSNSSTDFIKDLYKDYHIHIVKANRAINSDKSGRGCVDEVIITNYEYETANSDVLADDLTDEDLKDV